MQPDDVAGIPRLVEELRDAPLDPPTAEVEQLRTFFIAELASHGLEIDKGLPHFGTKHGQSTVWLLTGLGTFIGLAVDDWDVEDVLDSLRGSAANLAEEILSDRAIRATLDETGQWTSEGP